MALLKNWAEEAAMRIAERVHAAGGPIHVNAMQAIISECSPFKPDVAYMPVPRCETCHWWIREGRDYGFCQMSSVDETIPGLPPVEERDFGSRDLRAVRTRDYFGCVQWREKT